MSSQLTSLIEDSSRSLSHRVVGQSVRDGIRTLFEADLEAGFVEDDLREVDYYQVPSGDGRLPFLLQFNAKRANRLRTKGKGERSCALCLENVRRVRQQFVGFSIDGRRVIALSNPWPFMPAHVTVASAKHEGQAWRMNAVARRAAIAELVGDVLSLSRLLPGSVVIYNGEHAGASIPGHRHYQAFSLPVGQGPLPIEMVDVVSTRWRDVSTVADPSCFPLRFFRAIDVERLSLNSIVSLLVRWDDVQGAGASVNLIARSQAEGRVTLFIVPRNRLFRRAIGFAEVLGSLEVTGLFVVSSALEQQAIAEGRLTFCHLWRALEAVQPPNVSLLVG